MAVFPVLGRLLVSVRSSTDVVVTLRVVCFSSALVVTPRALVRSRSFVAVFPVYASGRVRRMCWPTSVTPVGERSKLFE